MIFIEKFATLIKNSVKFTSDLWGCRLLLFKFFKKSNYIYWWEAIDAILFLLTLFWAHSCGWWTVRGLSVIKYAPCQQVNHIVFRIPTLLCQPSCVNKLNPDLGCGHLLDQPQPFDGPDKQYVILPYILFYSPQAFGLPNVWRQQPSPLLSFSQLLITFPDPLKAPPGGPRVMILKVEGYCPILRKSPGQVLE